MRLSIDYIDRRSGTRRTEEIYAGAFLDWCSNARIGRAFTRVIMSRVWPTRLYGWWNSRRGSRARIVPFIARMGIDMRKALRPADEYASFADFFTREIDLAFRPIAGEEDACVSPVDGRILVFPVITGEAFRIKSHRFRLADFLRDDALLARYHGGSMAVIRLALADYHHVHFPVAGVPGTPRLIRGRRYIGGPYAVKSWMPFYRENVRMFTLLESPSFTSVLIAEIGSFAVAGIRQNFLPGHAVRPGDRKACFALGGSTVVLLFPPGVMRFDDDLVAHSAEDLETRVLMGEQIGRSNLNSQNENTRSSL